MSGHGADGPAGVRLPASRLARSADGNAAPVKARLGYAGYAGVVGSSGFISDGRQFSRIVEELLPWAHRHNWLINLACSRHAKHQRHVTYLAEEKRLTALAAGNRHVRLDLQLKDPAELNLQLRACDLLWCWTRVASQPYASGTCADQYCSGTRLVVTDKQQHSSLYGLPNVVFTPQSLDGFLRVLRHELEAAGFPGTTAVRWPGGSACGSRPISSATWPCWRNERARPGELPMPTTNAAEMTRQPALSRCSLAELVELYREITLELHGLVGGPAPAPAAMAGLRASRQRIYEHFTARKKSEMNTRPSALLIGFVGRYNSGDEMMLEMHLQILRGLGFEDVDIWTEQILDVTDFHYPLYWHSRKPYKLVVLGGGGLDVGYGFHQAFLAKVRYGARVVLSSINLPSADDCYLQGLNALADLVITRNAIEAQQLRQAVPRLRFLPDVSTIYQPPAGEASSERVAVVLRRDSQTIIDFAPAGDFDVLVLSRDDSGPSAAYARRFGGRLLSLWDRDPREHVQCIASYGRVLSVGRFHAALWAARIAGTANSCFRPITSPCRRTYSTPAAA